MMKLATLLLDAEGNEIDGYFWATDDPEEALKLGVEEANDEAMDYDCIVVVPFDYNVEEGDEADILGRYIDGEYEYYDRY